MTPSDNSDRYQNFLEREDLPDLDPLVDRLIRAEQARESNKLILIPSESLAPPLVRKALGSVFNNIYAEGYPREEMTQKREDQLADLADRLSHYRRYGNRRFYKGVEYVDLLESLAQRRAKECFSRPEVPPEQIQVNIQPLSGTAANLAIYESFVEPGGTVMGLDLSQGGHVSHGSEFNITGKRYDIVPYSTDPESGKLNYAEIREKAVKHQPEMIIAGYTSYSWAPDWKKFRAIADEVEAILLADISHTAGMAIAGAYPNPVGIADVTMTTTHKTICGPRGAIILTTDREKARMIDEAIFPGAQGGPHPNKFAAMAVAFRIAQTESFTRLQHQIVENAKTLSKALQKRGLELAYKGTDTHLMVLDLTKIENDTGFDMMGEAASRILDLAHIVTNKNTIPGDESAAVAHGLRIGTPWATQRGMEEGEMEAIADLIAETLGSIKPFSYIGTTNPLSRGKIDLGVLSHIRRQTGKLLEKFPPKTEESFDYPHVEISPTTSEDIEGGKLQQGKSSQKEIGLIRVSGHRPKPFLNQMSTKNILGLEKGEGIETALLDRNGELIDIVQVILQEDGPNQTSYLLLSNTDCLTDLLNRLRAISDGYMIFDEDDLFRKVEGPAVVEDLNLEGISAFGPLSEEELRDSILKGTGFEPKIQESITENGTNIQVYASERNPYKLYLWGDSTVLPDLIDPKSDEENQQVDRSLTGAKLFENRQNLFTTSSPYFVGQPKLEDRLHPEQLIEGEKSTFTFPHSGGEQEREGEGKHTPLHDLHVQMGAKMARFAGWDMPFWYSSVAEEHQAVREKAGLFDLGHMGVFQISGPGATHFLDVAISNYANFLRPGEAHYTFILDPEARVIDDAMVYRMEEEKYLIVVNAANEEEDWKWLNAVNSGQYKIDYRRPWVEVQQHPTLSNLKEESEGPKQLRNMALQGPRSRDILQTVTKKGDRGRLRRLEKNQIGRFQLESGSDVIVARTGYTGEELGYEIFLHPEKFPQLWNKLLDRGKEFGIQPVGLAGRDSTRIEAGLPLHGHELAGRHEINPIEAGFGAYVKFHKPYFIGRKAIMEEATSLEDLDCHIVRFRVTDSGARMVRENTPVFDSRGSYLGRVTSCAKTGNHQTGMAYLEKRSSTAVGKEVLLAPSLAGEKEVEFSFDKGTRLPIHYTAVILNRFPTTEGQSAPVSSAE